MDMWDQLLVAFKELLDKAEKTYVNKAKSAFPHYTPQFYKTNT